MIILAATRTAPSSLINKFDYFGIVIRKIYYHIPMGPKRSWNISATPAKHWNFVDDADMPMIG
jgi:hypothetical protein